MVNYLAPTRVTSSSVVLSIPQLSDSKDNGSKQARLGTATHFCKVVVLSSHPLVLAIKARDLACVGLSLLAWTDYPTSHSHVLQGCLAHKNSPTP